MKSKKGSKRKINQMSPNLESQSITTKNIEINHNIPQVKRPRIYADGIFDIFHLGHVLQLKQAKESLPNAILVVGVSSDELTHKLKGKTVFSEYFRVESVRHCRYVDEVITDAPWIITPEFMLQHSLDYVAHDKEPYPMSECDDIYGWLKEEGRFIPTQRTEGISTSDIITIIIKQYDDYIRRNLNRGISYKDMNVSFLKEKQMKVENQLKKIGQTFKTMENKLHNEVDEMKEHVHTNSDTLTISIQNWLLDQKNRIEGFIREFSNRLKKTIHL